jgi:hypothetical protein
LALERCMAMSRGAIITDLFALAAIVLGLLLAFNQKGVRRLWARWVKRGRQDMPLTVRPEGDNPVRYPLRIGGVMLMAFGLAIFAFTTAYELMTSG